MKHAIIYDRASSHHQEDNWSRDDARLVGAELAQKHNFTSWEVRREVKSGESLANRPVLQGILDDIAARRCHGLIVQNLSRLSRDEDMIDGAVIRSILRRNSVPVITPVKVYHFDNDSDEKASDIEFLLSKWYKQTLIGNVLRGQTARARAGLPVAKPSFGYKLIYLEGQFKNNRPVSDFAIDESLRKHVMLAFELVRERGLRGAANEFNRLSIPGSSDKKWTINALRRMVKNPLYAGFLTWGRKIQSRYLRGFEATQHYRPELAIVPLQLWELANETLRERSRERVAAGKTSKYPFVGILKCPVCAGPMYARRQKVHGNNYIIYFCQTNIKSGASACKGRIYSERVIRNAVLPFVAQLLRQKFIVDNALDTAAQRYGRTVTEEELKARIEAELHILKEQMSRLVKAIANGTLTESEAKLELEELRIKEDSLRRDLATIGQKAKVRADFQTTIETLREKNVEQMLEGRSDEALRQVLRLIFSSLVIESDRRGRSTKGWVANYKFTEDFEELASIDTSCDPCFA